MSALWPSGVAVAMTATLLLPTNGRAQARADTTGYTSAECPSCTEWNVPTAPVRVHGNTYYVGTRGLAAILIVSPRGSILIDGGLPESAPQIVANIRTLGFLVEDVRLLVNSHTHYDHAGGLAALQRMTGARVVASPRAVAALTAGRATADDPQFASALPFPPVLKVDALADGDTLRVGTIFVVAHSTPGHTPGGTSWSWRSCEDSGCLDLVYADSQTPISSDSFRFTGSTVYPTVLQDFERGFRVLETLSCDILLTPHPSVSNFWDRLGGVRGAPLVDREGCRRYAAGARQALNRRLSAESATVPR